MASRTARSTSGSIPSMKYSAGTPIFMPSMPRPSAARHAGQVPRVARGAEGGVLGGGAHRELVHVELAEQDRPRRVEPRDHRRVVRRDEAVEDLRTRGGTDAARAEQVLEGDRDTVERSPRIARLEAGIGLGRAAERVLPGDGEEGPQLRIDALDPGETLGDGPPGGRGAAPVPGRELMRGQRRQHAAATPR